MKDEFDRKFGKKELLETLIVVIVTLFLVCIGFLLPPVIGTILFIVGCALITILIILLIDFLGKRKK